MSFTAKQLAMRDPALAALVGAIGGSDFGDESSFGNDFAGWDAPGGEGFFGADFGEDGFFGNDGFGADAAPAAAIPRPTPQAALALWNQHHAKQIHTNRRASLLQPNQHSNIKVERYNLTLSQTVTIGTSVAVNITRSPDTDLRPQRLVSNIKDPNLVYVSEVKVANVSVTSGDAADASIYGPDSWGVQMDMPTLSPSNKATILGDYTGNAPANQESGNFNVTFTFFGPSSMAG